MLKLIPNSNSKFEGAKKLKPKTEFNIPQPPSTANRWILSLFPVSDWIPGIIFDTGFTFTTLCFPIIIYAETSIKLTLHVDGHYI